MKTKKLTFHAYTLMLFSAAILFQGCAVSPLPSEPILFRKETAKNGMIFGSITFPREKAKYNGYFIRVTSKSPDGKTAKANSTEIHIAPEQIWKVKHKGSWMMAVPIYLHSKDRRDNMRSQAFGFSRTVASL